MFAHVAGLPIEEMAASLGPLAVLAFSLGVVLVKERTRRRAYKRHQMAEPQR